jgi:hypothetical protein
MTYRRLCKVDKSNYCDLEHWKDDINEMRILYKCVYCAKFYHTILEESDEFFEIEEVELML